MTFAKFLCFAEERTEQIYQQLIAKHSSPRSSWAAFKEALLSSTEDQAQDLTVRESFGEGWKLSLGNPPTPGSGQEKWGL